MNYRTHAISLIFLPLTQFALGQPYQENIFWKGYWIWAAPTQTPPALRVNLGNYMIHKPGGWGGVLPNTILGNALSSGFDMILWDLCDSKGRLLYPSKNFDSAVLRWPNWGVDFSKYNYPQLAAEMAKRLKLKIKFVIDKKYLADARESLVGLDIITTLQADEIKNISLKRVDFKKQNKANLVHSPVCFHKEFNTVMPIESAFITMTAEEKYNLYLNGILVADGGGWGTPETFDIKPFLVSGMNVIAIKVIPDPDAASLLVNMKWSDKNGKHELATDESWKYSINPPENWPDIKFDDSEWKKAHIIGLDRLGSKRWWLKNPWVNPLSTSIDRAWLKRVIKDMKIESTQASRKNDIAKLGDNVLADTSSYRVGPFPQTITITLPAKQKLDTVRMYSGYIANFGYISSEMSVKSFSLEYWDGNKWSAALPPVTDSPAYNGVDGELFCYQAEFKPIETERIRITITDSWDTGIRNYGKINGNYRGCYIREIEVLKTK